MLRRHIVLLVSDSSVRWGRYAWRPPWCFLRRAGYDSAPGFIFSFHDHPTKHNYTTQKCYTYSHSNLSFLQYTIHILVPHVMWSAQVARDSKIDYTQRHLSALARNPKGVIVKWIGIGKHTHTHVISKWSL